MCEDLLHRMLSFSAAVWIFLSFTASYSAGQYECTEGGHRVLSEPFRSEEFTASAVMNELLCDSNLDRGWYKLEIFGKPAEMPRRCVQMNKCGTSAPIWLNTAGKRLPAPGDSGRFRGCTAWQTEPSTADSDACCYLSFPLPVTNCGDFFVYYLTPTRGCYMAYCSTGARRKCELGEVSHDGFAPCHRSFPTIRGLPEVHPTVYLDQPNLKCNYTVTKAANETSTVHSVTWYKADRGTDMFHAVKTDDTSATEVLIDLKAFRMGEKVLCTVHSFFNDTRDLMSPPVESRPFHITIQVSPKKLSISEDGERHLVSFESTIPLRCAAEDPQCQITIPLSVVTVGDTADITLSDCAVTFIPQTCAMSEERCRRTFVHTLAIVDFVTDDMRVSKITSQPIKSADPFWDGFDPEDIQVTVTDVPGGYCYSFTDPHFITFDRRKYSFFKTGTFVMFRSNAREFEVHTRFWECSNSVYPVSCNCGFVVREDNDVISVDMCRGDPYDTDVDIEVLSGQTLTDGIKILEAREGKKITIEFLSGAYVRADIADWGMSITLRVPSVDYGKTVGLCGTFDGDEGNDFDDNHDRVEVEPGSAEPVEFVERWRLPDGGMFSALPSSNPFGFRLPSCTCRNGETPSKIDGDLLLSSLLCPDGNCDSSCDKFEYAKSTPLIKSREVSERYTSRGFDDFGPLSLEEAEGLAMDPWPGIVDEGIPRVPMLEEIMYDRDDVHVPRSGEDGTDFRGQGFDLSLSPENNHVRRSRTAPDPRNDQEGGTNTEQQEGEGNDDKLPRVKNVREITNAYDPGQQEMETRTKRQLEGMEPGAISDFFALLNLDYNMFPIAPESRTANLVEAYRFSPDEEAPDLQPLVAKWPTPSAITEEQARDICERTLKCSRLGRLCGRVLAGVNGSIAEVVDVCVDDTQMTDDPTWRFEAIPLLENLCEAAAEKLGMNVAHTRHLRDVLNCPGNCSRNGICATFGCECTGGFEGADCSHETGVPVLLHIEKNGLCDKREDSCDQIRLSLRGLVRSASLECVFKNPRIMGSKEEASDVTITVPGRVVNRRTITCPVGHLGDSISSLTQASSFRQWDVLVSQDGRLSRGNLTLTLFDSLCVHCDWIHECTVRNGTCFIDGGCFTNRLVNPHDSCSVCLPDVSALQWSKSEENLPPVVIVPDQTYALVNESMTAYIEGTDPEGEPLHYVSDFEGVSVTDDGTLTWTPLSAGFFQVPVSVSDVCAEMTEFKLNVDVLECHCVNGGTCYLNTTDIATPTCSCPEHYGGTLCEKSLFDCPRCNHGTCIAGEEGGRCVCHAGFTGTTCATAIDPCSSDPCYPGVPCTALSSHTFSCSSCPRGMTGDGHSCTNKVDDNVCIPTCRHKGKCTKYNTCICKRGYFGNRCESSNCGLDCMNGGYCSGFQRCQCPEGYAGTTCAIPVCSLKCRNGGVCTKPGICSCPRGFHGSNCQYAKCSHICNNGGTCVRRNVCACAPGWTGNRCLTPVCEQSCLNGGRCVAPNRCRCPSGYKGRRCHKAMCVSACQNGGVCSKPNICSCKKGYTGSNCQNAVCNRPCMYGGRCVAHNRCQCRHGRRGRFCEKSPKRKRSRSRT